MELIFLGTSSGTPTKSRNVSGLALRRAGARAWCLIDCGEGTQHRLLHTRLSPMQLDTLLITHVHGDHCYGLPGLLASAALAGRTAPLRIIAPTPIAAFIECVARLSDLRLDFPIDFVPVESLQAPLAVQDFILEPVALSHRVPSYAYVFTETRVEAKLDVARLTAEGIPAGPLWGRLHRGEELEFEGRRLRGRDYRLPERAPRKVIIAGDNDSPALLAEAARGACLLVHEATYTREVAERLGPAPQHSDAERVARFAEQAGLPNLILTHFSPRYQDGAGSPHIDEIAAEARAHYGGRLVLARDLDHYRLSRQGELETAGPRRAGRQP
ncbi:ribonuclease Z [Zobellella sp. An-6]|uniref:ribonuclease Z n=1 Tax=Zobellella sp. An-6 TaxID=3400218 RepID=UPI0040436B38